MKYQNNRLVFSTSTFQRDIVTLHDTMRSCMLASGSNEAPVQPVATCFHSFAFWRSQALQTAQ